VILPLDAVTWSTQHSMINRWSFAAPKPYSPYRWCLASQMTFLAID